MTYSRPDEEGRALAYVGSILFSLGLGVFSAAAYGWRALTASVQNHGSADWPTAPGRITTCDVKAIHGRFIDYALGVIGYSYDIEGNYYSGYLARQFWDEQRAWTFVDSCRDKSIMVHYKLTNPEASVLRETEEIGLLAPRRGGFRVPGAGFAPGLGILWRLRDVSDWAEAKVQEHRPETGRLFMLRLTMPSLESWTMRPTGVENCIIRTQSMAVPIQIHITSAATMRTARANSWKDGETAGSSSTTSPGILRGLCSYAKSRTSPPKRLATYDQRLEISTLFKSDRIES